jgi:hypothetical protein
MSVVLAFGGGVVGAAGLEAGKWFTEGDELIALKRYDLCDVSGYYSSFSQPLLLVRQGASYCGHIHWKRFIFCSRNFT